MRCAHAAHDGDCKKVDEAAGNDKAMNVSSDDEMGDAEEPSSSLPKEHKTRRQTGKEMMEMYSYTINLVEMADTAEGGELQCGRVDLTFNLSQDLQNDTGARMRHHSLLHSKGWGRKQRRD